MSNPYENNLVPFPTEVPSELRAEVLGTQANNPWAGTNSSSRGAMYTKHTGQTLVIANPEVRKVQTGTERETAKYTHKIQFHNNSYIIQVLDKFPYAFGRNRIEYSPKRVIIFENRDHPDLEVDVLYDTDHHIMHNFFGFEYKRNMDVQNRVTAGARVGAGTIIADSPNVLPSGDYANGVNANVIMCSHPAGTEDGVCISQSFADRLKVKAYVTRRFSFGHGIVPLNMYGDDKNYKIFPDIGDKVREDGILCSLRDYIPELAPCDLSISSLQQVTQFDKSQFVEPNATVIDITVIKGQSKPGDLFTSQEDQVTKYHDAHMQFYNQLTDAYKTLQKNRGGHVPISHEFQRLLVEAHAFTDGKRKLQERRVDLPAWTVEITVMYDIPAERGFKTTDTHGGKSVVVDIKPDHMMPIDKMGNVVDIIVDDVSIIKRLIKGKPYEHYILASWRDTTTRIRDEVAQYNGRIPDKVYKEIFHHLMGLYKISSPPFYKKIQEIRPNIKAHVNSVIERGIHQLVPTDNPVRYLDVVELLDKYYPPCMSKLTFIDNNGELQETSDNILVGVIYYILLEKLGNDPSSVTSAKLQHYGLPSKPSTYNRYDSPHKRTPVRFGESEMRLFTAFAGGLETADLVDRTTNIAAHEGILDNLLAADKPSDVYNLVDRDKHPIGGGHIQKIVKHEFESMGLKYSRSSNKD